MNSGFGSAVFYFLGPIAYYISAVFHLFFGNDHEGWRQLAWATSIAIIASGYSAYAWLKEASDETGALVGAVLYMSMPYHIAFALYYRFGYAELWAFVWLPLIMRYCEKVVAGKEKYIIPLAISYALLILTHITSALVFSWVPLAYSFFWSINKFRATLQVVMSLVLGAGLSAFYLVPALTTQSYVSFSTLWAGFADYRHHFLFDVRDNFPASRPFVETLEPLVLFMVAIGISAFVVAIKYGVGVQKKTMMLWVAITIFTFALMTPVSKPLWEWVRLIQLLQFPWRFSILLCLATSLLVSCMFSIFFQKENKILLLFFPFIFVVAGFQIFPAMFQMLNYARAISPPHIDKLMDVFSDQPDKIRAALLSAKINRDIPELRPIWVEPELFMESTKGAESMLSLSRKLQSVNIVGGDGVVDIISWRSGNIVFKANSSSGLILNLHQFYYPAWSASMDQKDVSIRVVASKPTGLIEIKVPPGLHEVRVKLLKTGHEKIGLALSIFSLMAIAILIVYKNKYLFGRPHFR
jgi:hypothetical protein